MFVRHWYSYLLPPPTVAGRRVRQSPTVQPSAPASPPLPSPCSRADTGHSDPNNNMTNYIRITFALCACVALAAAQFHSLDYGLDYNDNFAPTNFGGPLLNTLSAAGARDPRANTGPVLFPPAPPSDGRDQTSGVVVGASGYGFVPPGSQGPASPRFYYPGFFLGR